MRFVLKSAKLIFYVFRPLRKILKSFNSFAMSVCPSEWNNSALTGGIFMKFDT